MYAYNELLYENTKAYSPVGSGVHRNSERVRSAKRLALLLLWMGFQKSLRAKDYYDNTQKKWEIASFVVGVSVCICGFLSLTNLI